MRDVPLPARHNLFHTAAIVVVVIVLYGIVFTTPMLGHIAEGVNTVQKMLSERSPVEPLTDAAVSTPRQNDDYEFEIEPMWSCSDTDRKKKLVFVHIFKTAGSSLRQLLSKYAETCNAGYVTVISCSGTTLQSLETGRNWEKDREHGLPEGSSACFLKKTVYRNNTVVDEGTYNPINTTFLEEAKVDIVSGHVTMGIDEKWKDDDGKHVDVQYLTFFREGKRKVVSGVLYLRPKLSFEEAVDAVKVAVRRRVANSDYLTNVKNIMTPAQRDDYRKRNVTLTMEEKADLMIQNLKDNNVLIGIVDRMSESLEMLQHVVDKDGELVALFESYGKRPPGTNATKGKIANMSKLSSEAVLAEVEKDEEFMKVMREFVKYDEKVYQFAFDMHMRQYEAFRQKNPQSVDESLKVGAENLSEEVVKDETQLHASPAELDEHAIAEVTPTLDDYQSAVEPMWSCKDKTRKKKLVFVHVFKTAGSTMRNLLRAYSETCHAGLNMVIRCAPVLPSTIRTGNWLREDKETCVLKQTIYRNSTRIQGASSMNITHLEESNADILSGHITLGTERDWKDDKGKHVDVQYLVFFRESTHKFVSGVLYLRPKFTLFQAVAHIKEIVPMHVKNGVYLDNSGYLLTPAQRDEFQNATLSMEDKVRLTMKTLKENNVLVGIVERMSESLEMIQGVVDKDGELDSMFESFGKRRPGSNATKVIKANKSKLSSESVVAELEKDEEFMKVMQEFVKYDNIVYRFAMDVHMRQYESFQHQSKTTQ